MPLFHTGLFSNDPPGDAFLSRGAAWTFQKESGLYTGPRKELNARSAELFQQRGRAATSNIGSDGEVPFFDMEILIRAEKFTRARQALNLLISSKAVLDGAITFLPEPFSVDPIEVGDKGRRGNFGMSANGFLSACKLASRVSRARRLTYAVHKLALSYQSCSPAMMDLHPSEAPRLFGVEPDPIFHVYFANAVTLAYSSIEELGLEIRADHKNPSRMPDGTWNLKVKADIRARLCESGIDPSATHVWTLRGPKTLIERNRPPNAVSKPTWSRRQVRDVEIALIDALALASWLRSTTTTHRFTKTTASLTTYDAHNVQSLARQLIMQKLGLW